MQEKFTFKYFQPSYKLITESQLTLTAMMDLAPSDSSCQAIMIKEGEEYSAKVEIKSTDRSFIVRIDSLDPFICLREVKARLIDQFRSWRIGNNIEELTII